MQRHGSATSRTDASSVLSSEDRWAERRLPRIDSLTPQRTSAGRRPGSSDGRLESKSEKLPALKAAKGLEFLPSKSLDRLARRRARDFLSRSRRGGDGLSRATQRRVDPVKQSRKNKRKRPAVELKITAFGASRNDSPGPAYLPGFTFVATKAPSFSFGAFHGGEKEEKEREWEWAA